MIDADRFAPLTDAERTRLRRQRPCLQLRYAYGFTPEEAARIAFLRVLVQDGTLGGPQDAPAPQAHIIPLGNVGSMDPHALCWQCGREMVDGRCARCEAAWENPL